MSRKIPNAELSRLSKQEFQQAKKHPIVLVLDNVRSMQNVGAMFRTADAFLIQQIHLCGITATPPHRDILKTALGATETVDWAYFDTTAESIKQLKESDFQIVSVEQVEGSISLETVQWENKQPVALVFGHEINGVSQDIVNQSDACIEIPQLGTKHSFNISVSAGIVLWQYLSKHMHQTE